MTIIHKFGILKPSKGNEAFDKKERHTMKVTVYLTNQGAAAYRSNKISQFGERGINDLNTFRRMKADLQARPDSDFMQHDVELTNGFSGSDAEQAAVKLGFRKKMASKFISKIQAL